ncbi:MAG: hypothetical protein Q8N30_04115 [Methylococcales bacterium]|nr:hypothetical protein [Methylococcales bacterium]
MMNTKTKLTLIAIALVVLAAFITVVQKKNDNKFIDQESVNPNIVKNLDTNKSTKSDAVNKILDQEPIDKHLVKGM